MTAPLRRLAPSELGFVGPYPTTCAFELTVRGRLDLNALRAALVAVRASHPALDAAVSEDGDGFAFVTPGRPGGAALTVVEADAVEDAAETPAVDPTATLGRLHVVTAGDRHRISLAVNHALADGAYLFAVLSDLWSRYTALVRTGAAATAVPHAFPSSAQHVLRDVAAGTDTGRDRQEGARWYGAAPVGAIDRSLPDVLSLRFSAEVTARFTAAAGGIGVNALLSGVLLCAERAGFPDEAPEAPIRIGAMTLVDLRRRVRPALAATAVTNFVGASFAAPDLTASSDPATVGSAVSRQVRDDIAAGRCLAVLAHPAPPALADPPVVLSNLGPLALDLPNDLVAEHLRPVVSMDSAALHGDPGPRRPSPSATIYQASTFHGRLGVEAIRLGGTASAASRSAVAERLVDLVHAVARLAPAA